MHFGLTMIALGGNALKGQHKFQDFPELARACQSMAKFKPGTLVVTHGNGPQIGDLVLTEGDGKGRSLDVLGAETEGLLGYQIEQELSNNLEDSERVVTLLTRVEVDSDDPAFVLPTKPIGPWISEVTAQKLVAENDWQFTEREGKYRRIVPSPRPKKILQTKAISKLLNSSYTVICTGGGGIPVCRKPSGHRAGIEAVIDKDFASSLLARQLGVKILFLVTDVEGIYTDWGTPDQSLIKTAAPDELRAMDLPAGSMGPKAEAACEFVEATGNKACIGSLSQLEELLQGSAGTWIEANPRQEEV